MLDDLAGSAAIERDLLVDLRPLPDSGSSPPGISLPDRSRRRSQRAFEEGRLPLRALPKPRDRRHSTPFCRRARILFRGHCPCRKECDGQSGPWLTRRFQSPICRLCSPRRPASWDQPSPPDAAVGCALLFLLSPAAKLMKPFQSRVRNGFEPRRPRHSFQLLPSFASFPQDHYVSSYASKFLIISAVCAFRSSGTC